MQSYQPDLRLVANYARAGAAAKAQRENQITALQVANQQQQQQNHVDGLLAQLQQKNLDREYQKASDTQKLLADQTLAQQKMQYAAQKDLIDHQQALELQGGRQEHSQQMQAAKSVDQRVAELQKQLASAKLTPFGRQLANKQLGILTGIRAAEAKGMYSGRFAAERAQHLTKWANDTDALGLENHQVVEPTPAEQWKKDVVDLGNGKVSVPIRDTTGRIVRWKIESTAGTDAEDEMKKRKEFGEQHRRDTAEAERRLKARFEADPANDGVKKAFTDDEIQAEVARMKAVEEARYRAQQSGVAPPATATQPTTTAPPAFTPNVSPATDIVSAPPPPAKSVITKPQVWEDQNVNVPLDHPSIAHADKMGVPHFAHEAGQNGVSGPVRGFMWKDWLAIGGKPDGTFEPKQPAPQPAPQPVPTSTPFDTKESRQDGRVMQWLDEQGLTPYTSGATARDLAVLPQDAFKQFLESTRARKAAAEAQQSAPTDPTPSNSTATQATTTAKPASIESAIEDTDEVKLPFGDSQIVTRSALKLADGKKLATATVDIRGRKLRSVFTGGVWRVLHVDEAGQINPIGTLPGPDAGAKHSPIEFHSNDAAAISAAVPKGTWLRDESGTLYENE